MRIEVKVPQLPESITEATLVNWHKKPGEPVKRDENLIDVETDKVVLELPAPADGVLVEVTRPDGATVTSNDIIGVIYTDNRIRSGIFSESERDLLIAFANQAAVSIENARLFSSLNRTLEEVT